VELIITGSYVHPDEFEEDFLVINHSHSIDFMALHKPLTFLYIRELYVEEPANRKHEHKTILDTLPCNVSYGLQSLALSVDRSQLVSHRTTCKSLIDADTFTGRPNPLPPISSLLGLPPTPETGRRTLSILPRSWLPRSEAIFSCSYVD
jgi:hypothetical protein